MPTPSRASTLQAAAECRSWRDHPVRKEKLGKRGLDIGRQCTDPGSTIGSADPRLGLSSLCVRREHEWRGFGLVQYKSPVGLFSAGVDSSAEETTGRVEAQGALSLVDRSLFPSNIIFDSFAIVDTNPLRHVNVLQENRDVGSTGSSGRLLVPDMRPFELNHLAIAAADLPADVAIHTTEREVRPQDRSGVIVRFPIKVSHGALVRLVDESGTPLLPGSSATLRATGVTVPMGYDGEAYVEDLGSSNELTVALPGGRHCTVVFEYRPIPGEIPTIGPLRCIEGQP